jgi:hypothetical protein
MDQSAKFLIKFPSNKRAGRSFDQMNRWLAITVPKW